MGIVLGGFVVVLRSLELFSLVLESLKVFWDPVFFFLSAGAPARRPDRPDPPDPAASPARPEMELFARRLKISYGKGFDTETL